MEETYGLKDYSDNSPVSSRDPVCGAVVVEDRAAGKTGYAGEMFYFCSKDCQKRFEEEPGRYIGKSE
jgi:YHS domain-containing protein